MPKRKPGLPWWGWLAIGLVVLMFAISVLLVFQRTATEEEQRRQVEQEYKERARDIATYCLRNPLEPECERFR